MGDLEHNMTIYEALMDLLTTSTETVDIVRQLLRVLLPRCCG